MSKRRVWLWRNFVNGRPEYWAFDNAFPVDANGDPLTLGEPCGYAIIMDSQNGRPEISDEEVTAAVRAALARARGETP